MLQALGKLVKYLGSAVEKKDASGENNCGTLKVICMAEDETQT